MKKILTKSTYLVKYTCINALEKFINIVTMFKINIFLIKMLQINNKSNIKIKTK